MLHTDVICLLWSYGGLLVSTAVRGSHEAPTGLLLCSFCSLPMGAACISLSSWVALRCCQCGTLRAVFGHLSIRGATVSSSEQGRVLNEGLDVELLPNVPLYSGHIHTPQLIGKQARYIGSLYQVCNHATKTEVKG